MGLDNRDYIRYSEHQGAFGGGGGGGWPPVVKALLAINIVVFLGQLFLTPPRGATSPIQTWLALDWGSIKSGQIWRLLTYSFCHSTQHLFHIAANMLGLVIIGRPIERLIGSREFLAFYLVAAVFGGVVYLLADFALGPGSVVGASGAVLAILVLFACHFPRQEVLLFFVMPIQVRWVVLIVIVLDLLTAVSGRASVDGGTAVAAHLGGIIFAFLYWKAGIRLEPFFSKFSKNKSKSAGGKAKGKRKKSNLTTDGRSKAEIDQQVDQLLQKISDEGFQSLTEKEKKFLEKASDKFG